MIDLWLLRPNMTRWLGGFPQGSPDRTHMNKSNHKFARIHFIFGITIRGAGRANALLYYLDLRKSNSSIAQPRSLLVLQCCQISFRAYPNSRCANIDRAFSLSRHSDLGCGGVKGNTDWELRIFSLVLNLIALSGAYMEFLLTGIRGRQ